MHYKSMDSCLSAGFQATEDVLNCSPIAGLRHMRKNHWNSRNGIMLKHMQIKQDFFSYMPPFFSSFHDLDKLVCQRRKVFSSTLQLFSAPADSLMGVTRKGSSGPIKKFLKV
jgi:hypothetical protein